MNVAIVSEYVADEIAVRILAESILGFQMHRVEPRLRTRGWPSTRDVLPAILTELHYEKRHCEGLIVVVDSDNAPIHVSKNKHEGGDANQCRHCALQSQVERTMQKLNPVENRVPLRTAIGVATPAIEAWLYCSRDSTNKEGAWVQKLISHGSLLGDRKALKKKVYGSDRPSTTSKLKHTMDQAVRVAERIAVLEQSFPNGFGAMARDLRSWKTGPNAGTDTGPV